MSDLEMRREHTCQFIDGRDDRGPKEPICSVCGYRADLGLWKNEGDPKEGVYKMNYCPNCGAKVVGDE